MKPFPPMMIQCLFELYCSVMNAYSSTTGNSTRRGFHSQKGIAHLFLHIIYMYHMHKQSSANELMITKTAIPEGLR